MFGESLCKIKNSPFYRPGDMKSTSLANDNTRGLSYDPNRLFAPDKHV